MNLIRRFLDTTLPVDQRVQALMAYSSRGQNPTPLFTLCTDPQEEIRDAVATGLGRVHHRQAYDPLLSMLTDSSSQVREYVILGLGESRDSRALFPLVNYYSHQASHREKKLILIALSHLRDPRAQLFLKDLPLDKTDQQDSSFVTLQKRAYDASLHSSDFVYTFVREEAMRQKAESKKGIVLVDHLNKGRVRIQDSHSLDAIDDILTEEAKEHWKKPQTYIVDKRGRLFVGGYLNEHVDVAIGRDVIAAGEIEFEKDPHWIPTRVNNRSYGYYPDSSCLEHVVEILKKTSLYSSDLEVTSWDFHFFEEDFLRDQPFFKP